MKKILSILLFLSIGTLVLVSCKFIFGTTYSVSTDGGYCYEITTNEVITISALELLGAVEEPCDTANVAASCTAISSEYNQEMVNYYSAEYLTNVPGGVEGLIEDCAEDSGTWKTY